MKKWNLLLVLGSALSVVALGMFLLSSSPFTVYASGEMTTKIVHKSPGYYVSGKRIQLQANVVDETGIALVRCYFRASGQADFVFVPMSEKEKAVYSAILPAVGSQVPSLEYLFLIVAGQNRVVKSQTFTLKKEDQKETPSWQLVEKEGPIQVSTEIAQSSDVAGYYADNIALDVVESAFRFGYVVALYQASQMAAAGGATGTAATATSAGTVSAAAGAGLSTAAIVGIAAGVAVTAGAVAAGSSKSSSSGGSTGGGNVYTGGTGEVKVTLQWSTCTDLDLIVTDPCSNNIYFGRSSATCQGRIGILDLDANVSSCSSYPVENIYWVTAPTGTYSVTLQNYRGAASAYSITTLVKGVSRTFTGTSPAQGGSRTITTFGL